MSGSGARRVGIVFAVLMVAILFWDLTREAEDQWSTKVHLTGIDLYQATLSPRMEDVGVRCRFQPTCSHYAEAVIREEGAMKGTWRAVGRIARCGPWTPAGTVDQP